MTSLAGKFDDPFDPPRSLQLNNRYWPGESFARLDSLREADDDLRHRRFASLRRSLKPIKALLPPEFHRVFVARLVYTMLFSTAFEPIRFKLSLSDAFVRANAYTGADTSVGFPARAVDELKYIVDLAHAIYRDQYGRDVLASQYGVRYVSARNPDVAERITKYGDFSDYHFDEGKDFTAIVYLSEVARDNGCFSYLDGTSRFRKSHVLRALHQVVGNYMGRALPEQTAGLPLELRGSLGLGNFLDDEKRETLRAARVDVVGGVGEGIIFSGFDTLHRGGKPLEGERTALFISTNGVFTSRLKRYASQTVASLLM